MHFFATRQKEQPPSQISVIDSHFRFSNLAYIMHPKEEKKSINKHNYHSFLKHYPILVCHNYYKFYPQPENNTNMTPPTIFYVVVGYIPSDVISISTPYPTSWWTKFGAIWRCINCKDVSYFIGCFIFKSVSKCSLLP